MLNHLKNVALFIAAPFIALAYIVALPAVGFYMFINLAIEATHKKATESKQSEDTVHGTLPM